MSWILEMGAPAGIWLPKTTATSLPKLSIQKSGGRKSDIITLSLILFNAYASQLGAGKHQGPASLFQPGSEGGSMDKPAWAQNSCSPSLPQVSDSSRKTQAQEQATLLLTCYLCRLFPNLLSHLGSGTQNLPTRGKQSH